jgi:hypothetical protein
MVVTKTQNEGMSGAINFAVTMPSLSLTVSDILLAIQGMQARLDEHRECPSCHVAIIDASDIQTENMFLILCK